MHPTSRFDATTTMHLYALISDLYWRVQMLDADIQEAEQKANNSDPSSLTYPVLAQTLRARRENVRASIAMLEGRLDRLSETTRAA